MFTFNSCSKPRCTILTLPTDIHHRPSNNFHTKQTNKRTNKEEEEEEEQRKNKAKGTENEFKKTKQ